jgi:hypothetical protein
VAGRNRGWGLTVEVAAGISFSNHVDMKGVAEV